ncbi:unnamed protein product [Mycena citricolor]|uniref:Uncharacterized protein n=1 Tax=Mycena citricolor TaxID=2018698 RepID=A0AAD2HK43_9AGAR|nr:unnamed protein product [Mycena citricolor]
MASSFSVSSSLGCIRSASVAFLTDLQSSKSLHQLLCAPSGLLDCDDMSFDVFPISQHLHDASNKQAFLLELHFHRNVTHGGPGSTVFTASSSQWGDHKLLGSFAIHDSVYTHPNRVAGVTAAFVLTTMSQAIRLGWVDARVGMHELVRFHHPQPQFPIDTHITSIKVEQIPLPPLPLDLFNLDS